MRRTAAILVGLGLLAAACGGWVGPTSGPTSVRPSASVAFSAPSAQPSGEARARRASKPKLVDPRVGGFEVGFGEYAITTETKAIRPGAVTLAVRNGGRLTHGLEMKAEGESSGHGGGDRFKVEEPSFGPGQSFKLTLTLTPGVYELECYVANHEELGMLTILRVGDDAPLVKQAKADGNSVDIRAFAFGPEALAVPVGTRVTWRNEDPTAHTVTSKDGSFGSDPLASGTAFSTTFDQPGEYRYFCAIHPTMEGVIRVTG